MSYVLSLDKQIKVIHLLARGASIRSIEDTQKIHRDTIMRLGVKVGQKCQLMLDKTMKNIKSNKIQVDEMEDNYYLKNLFLSFLQACKHLPDDIFVKNDKFHLALFESVFVAVCKKPFSQSSIITKPIELSAIQKLAADEEFVESIQKNTTSTANVKKRLLRASFFLNL